MKFTFKYILFAVIATLTNILAQEITTHLYTDSNYLFIPIFVGTIAGLLVKYILDKKYIFHHRSETIKQDTQMFFLYSAMGVVTTIIFWGTELAFDYIFQNKAMRYLGAVIGLAVGYWIKYHLDKRFVFRSPAWK